MLNFFEAFNKQIPTEYNSKFHCKEKSLIKSNQSFIELLLYPNSDDFENSRLSTFLEVSFLSRYKMLQFTHEHHEKQLFGGMCSCFLYFYFDICIMLYYYVNMLIWKVYTKNKMHLKVLKHFLLLGCVG